MGWVYIVGGERSGMVKIGFATDVGHRLQTIQTDNHLPLILCYVKRGTLDDEEALMERFAEFRVRGSWFRASPDTALGEFLEAATRDPYIVRNVNAHPRYV